MERRNAWKVYDQTELEKLDKINETYKNCLDDGKTERECITLAVKKAEAAGYKNLKELQKEHVKLKAGDKVYAVCMDKSIVLFIIGQEPLENGMNILGAHIDSPRIDVKQNPLYENEGRWKKLRTLMILMGMNLETFIIPQGSCLSVLRM